MAAPKKRKKNSPSNFVICVRDVQKSVDRVEFGTEPGETLYLEVPDDEIPHPVKHKKARNEWVQRVLKRATSGRHRETKKNPRSGYTTGDILYICTWI